MIDDPKVPLETSLKAIKEKQFKVYGQRPSKVENTEINYDSSVISSRDAATHI